MIIKKLQSDKEAPWDLLLSADPSKELVQNYLDKGECYVAEQDSQIVGVVVVCPIDLHKLEIMNIAVTEDLHGQGIGKKLIRAVLEEAEEKGFHLVEVGTGNSSFDALRFYQKCRFRINSIDFDFFVRNYSEKIMENGIWCRDMVRLVYTFNT